MQTAGDVAVALIDMRSVETARPAQRATRAVVVVPTDRLARHGDTVESVLGGPVLGLLCVAVGALGGGGSAPVLTRPQTLLDPRCALLWADPTPFEDGDARIDLLLGALTCTDVFDAVLKALSALPDRVANAGLSVGTDLCPPGELDTVLGAAVGVAVARGPARHDPLPAGLMPPPPVGPVPPERDSAVAEASRTASRRINEVEAAARWIGRWNGLLGGHRRLGREIAAADAAVAQHREHAAQLLRQVDAHVRLGMPAAEAVLHGAPSQAGPPTRDPRPVLDDFVAGAVRSGSVPAVARLLRGWAGARDLPGCPREVDELRASSPRTDLGAASPVPIATVVAVAVTCLPAGVVAGPAGPAALGVGWLAAVWFLLAGWPVVGGIAGASATVFRAALLVVPAASLVVVAIVATGVVVDGGTAMGVAATAGAALLGAVFLLRAAGAAGRRLRAVVPVTDLRSRVAATDRTVATVLGEQWVPAGRARAEAALLRSAANRVETAVAGLARWRTDTRVDIRDGVIALLRDDIGAMISAVLDENSASAPNRIDALMAAHRDRVAEQGLGVPPAYDPRPGERDRLLGVAWQPASAMLADPAGVVRERVPPMCPPDRAGLLAGPVEIVRFAPRRVTAPLTAMGTPADPDVVWCASGALAGALVLAAMCEAAVSAAAEPSSW